MISYKSAAKNTAEYGTDASEETGTLLSKTRKNYSIQTCPNKILYLTQAIRNFRGFSE
jgi:hypothetical protein